MILKMRALLCDLADFCERENLVAATIGQDRSVPIHEAMESAKVPHHLKPWPNEKVISVPENNLRLKFAQLARTHSFDRALGPDRHESGRFDHTVRRR